MSRSEFPQETALKLDRESSRTYGINPAKIHSFGSFIVLVTLFSLSAGTMVLAYFESSLAAGIDVPALSLCLGALCSILTGSGLTVLVLYGSLWADSRNLTWSRLPILNRFK
jgi:L-lactate permease